MTTLQTATRPAPQRIQHRAGAVFLAYAFGVTMMGTTLPTPLYSLYQGQFGYSSLLTTVIYGVYAGGVLAALLLFGRASDVLGRRRILLAGLAASALSAAVFLTDSGLPALFAGRILSGLSAGVFTGTATVALVELMDDRRPGRSTMVATVVNMLGLGSGPLLAGLLAEYVPHPLRLPFLMNLGLLALAAIGVWLMPETVPVRRGVWIRPQGVAIPAEVRTAFIPAAIAVFAAFAVFGLLTVVQPGFLATLLHQSNRSLAGAIVFSMFAGSAVGQALLGRLPQRIALPIGCLVLLVGLGGIAAALIGSLLAPLVAGTVIVGIGQGISFRAGMEAITARTPADRRAETVSSFFVVAYVAISVPVILVGVAVTLWGLRAAGIAFTAVVAVITLAALALISRRPA